MTDDMTDPTPGPATPPERPMPERIQRCRVKGWRMPDGAVYVGRPSAWGNPYRVGAPGVPDIVRAVYLFRWHLELAAMGPGLPSMELVTGGGLPTYPNGEAIRRALRGKDLVCWCPVDQPCHADVLLELANA